MIRRLLFVLAILASSFLIFLVQPMVAKRILPWFGGTASVWTLCLAFYQTTLFAGYAYAHFLIRFTSPIFQLGVHAVVLTAAFLALPVLPSDAWKSGSLINPNVDVLTMLGSSVALPFAALAATGPLVQAWFARSYPNRSPYPLYAVSNIGSLFALLAYPFLLEPRLPLSTTGTLWSFAFAATAVSVLGCAFIAHLAQQPQMAEEISGTNDELERTPKTQVAMWILLAGCAVILLMGVTNSVCLDVASVPFLWILPLATYLVTFILCFGSESHYRRGLYVTLTILTFFLTVGQRFILEFGLPLLDSEVGDRISVILASLFVQIPAYCGLLFGSCMILHGELYRLRPPPRALTAFYLCVSGGGALGGLFVGLLAPVLFNDYYEILVGLGLGMLLFVAANSLSADSPGLVRLAGWRWRIAAPAGLVLGIIVLVPPAIDPKVVVHRERGFFGVLQVTEFGVDRGLSRQRHLQSGSTLHGVQFIRADGSRPIPSSYYGRATGIAAAFALRRPDRPIHVGLIGLGVGTLSAYGRKGDSFRYYEIDPAVAFIARDSGYFSFLDHSLAEVEVILGDARLEIDREAREPGFEQFDFLVLDAFSSDAIPVHLLTVEAFRLYENTLATGGLLAVHVSNRHFDLIPLVARVGIEVGLKALVVETEPVPKLQSQASDWILLSRDEQRLKRISEVMTKRTFAHQLSPQYASIERLEMAELRDVPFWSDDYSNLVSFLRSK